MMQSRLEGESAVVARLRAELAEEKQRGAALEETLVRLAAAQQAEAASEGTLATGAALDEVGGIVGEGGGEGEEEEEEGEEVTAEAAAAAAVGGGLERFTIEVARDEESGTLGVDVDKWHGKVLLPPPLPPSLHVPIPPPFACPYALPLGAYAPCPFSS